MRVIDQYDEEVNERAMMWVNIAAQYHTDEMPAVVEVDGWRYTVLRIGRREIYVRREKL